MIKQFYFKQFNYLFALSLISNSSTWPIHMTLSGVTAPDHSGPRSDGHKKVLHIPQSFSVARASPSDCLVSYPWYSLVGRVLPSTEMQSVYCRASPDYTTGHSLGESYLSAEMQSVSSIAPPPQQTGLTKVDMSWNKSILKLSCYLFIVVVSYLSQKKTLVVLGSWLLFIGSILRAFNR